MAYIGSPPASQAFAPGTDVFSGDGSQTTFSLTRNVSTVNDVLVVVNNVDQQPTAYSVSGSVITFTAPPSVGVDNIYVRYLSTNLQSIAPQQASVTNQALDVANGGIGTGAAELPSGTTAQRPVAPQTGYTRVNTTTGFLEYWDGSAWATGGGGGGGDPATPTTLGTVYGATSTTTGTSIGYDASTSYDNSIVISGTGGGLAAPNAGVFIDSIRDESAGSPDTTLKYNSTTKEIFYGAGASPTFPASNSSTISQDITVTTGNNAMLVGPITFASGYSLTVESGANFVLIQ